MYAYYGTNMTGRRVASSLPSDGYADAFATVGDGRVRILAGVRQQTGTWQLQVNGLASLGFPESGAVSIQTYAFNTNGLYEAVDGPEDRGVYEHSISGGSVKFEIRMPAADVDTAFAFEFAVPG